MNKKPLIPLFFLTLLFGVSIGFLLSEMTNYVRISNVARIKTLNLNVYWYANATNHVTLIEWGLLEPDTNKTYVVYCQSASNVELNVTIYADNWNPLNCSDYMMFNASPNDFVLLPSQIIATSLTLTVFSNVTESGIIDFGFDIVFSGSENLANP